MRKLLAISFFVVLLFSITSCSKNGSNASDVQTTDCSTPPYRLGTTITMSAVGGDYKKTTTFNLVTTYNGINYFGYNETTNSGTVASYFGEDSSENIWQLTLPFQDFPQRNEIIYKPNQSIGTSWSYTYASVSQPSLISYKNTYQVIKNGIVFNLGGKTYMDCSEIQETLETFRNGVSEGPGGSSGHTWACDIGFVQAFNNGSLSYTLTSYTY